LKRAGASGFAKATPDKTPDKLSRRVRRRGAGITRSDGARLRDRETRRGRGFCRQILSKCAS